MQIQPEGVGIHEAHLSAVSPPHAGLSKPELAALIQKIDDTDAVTLLDVAAVDLPKLIPILQPPEVHTAEDHPEGHPATLVARLDAGLKLDQAEQAMTLTSGRKLPEWETAPQVLLHIGHRLYNAGGYVNYVRAAALAETIQSAFWGASLINDQVSPPIRLALPKESAIFRSQAFAIASSFQKMPAQVRKLWRRAPLLVLLLGWLAVGIAGGILFNGSFGFDFWAVGSLALVGFGFYSTIRKSR